MPLHGHELSFVRAHVYVLCVVILTGQLLLQLSIVLYQRLQLFYFLLDATVTNAYILYKESVQKRTLVIKELVLRMCEHLLSSANCRKRSSVQDPPPAARLCERHFPDCFDKPQQCKVCTERRRTRICLKTCCPEQPVDLCPVDCFSLYHMKLHEPKFLTVLCDYFTDSHFISVYGTRIKRVYVLRAYYTHGHGRMTPMATDVLGLRLQAYRGNNYVRTTGVLAACVRV